MLNYDTERYRVNKTIYQWRCSEREKEQLKMQAIREKRTATKVLSDALRFYLMAPEKVRKEKLYRPKNQVSALGW